MHVKTLQSDSISRVVIEMESFGLTLFHRICRGFNEVERECKMERVLTFIEAKSGGGGGVLRDS